ncbi:hypothetical protein G9C98_004229 [Cotesia typhae]|uniref:Tetratricopeptide repeat protein 30 n=1 Tax=Cotesia typhae TaxID=2053667 RepID=A0A8J5QYI7_9HYME|nr:hypothetical protein G9C98_004229 [Cotesia typhae]
MFITIKTIIDQHIIYLRLEGKKQTSIFIYQGRTEEIFYLYDFLDALITQQTAPEEAYRKLDDLANKHCETLRKLAKQVQEARLNHDENAVKKTVNDYDETLERYIPVLMAQAKIYWELENYVQVEKIFRMSADFSEELMKKIEKEEETVAFEEQDKKLFHLCIVNMVIGTLYCAKGNYEFGISRVMKSLEPYNKKLGTDTWFYAKRCFLSLLEQLANQLVVLKDSTIQECIQFLEQCEAYGRDVSTIIEQPYDINEVPLIPEAKHTVTYEARFLKALFLKIQMS